MGGLFSRNHVRSGQSSHVAAAQPATLGSSASAPSSANAPYLIVGLGNPGTQYENTRHNVSFSSQYLGARAMQCSVCSFHAVCMQCCVRMECSVFWMEGYPVGYSSGQSVLQIGFEAIDYLAQSNGLTWGKKLEHGALVATGSVKGAKVILCKPMTFMNNSGESVAPLARYYKVPLDKVCI